jgi:hypothetical protein
VVVSQDNAPVRHCESLYGTLHLSLTAPAPDTLRPASLPEITG